MHLIKNKRKFLIISGILTALIAGGITLYWQMKNKKSNATSVSATVTKSGIRVTKAKLKKVTFAKEQSIQGFLSPKKEVIVGVEVGGYRLLDLPVNVGDSVKAGQVIGKISAKFLDSDIKQAEASLADLQASLDLAGANLARAEATNLEMADAISNTEIRTLQATKRSMEAKVASSSASLNNLKTKKASLDIVAPVSGTIVTKAGVEGAILNLGAELVRILAGNAIELKGEIAADKVSDIRLNQSVSLVYKDKTIQGTVKSIAPAIDSNSRTGIIYVSLPEIAFSQGWKPGLQVTGKIKTGQAESLVAPLGSLKFVDGRFYLPVLVEDKVKFVEIEKGQIIDNSVEVLNSGAPTGLSDETEIVEKGAGYVNAGDTVIVIANELPPSAPPVSKGN